MDKRELATIIGNNLCILRTDSGLTQEELAESAGISTSFYANLERGNKGVSVTVLYKLAECLGVTVDRLLYEPTGDTHVKNIEMLLNVKESVNPTRNTIFWIDATCRQDCLCRYSSGPYPDKKHIAVLRLPLLCLPERELEVHTPAGRW